jgi:hypothetical protein
LAVIASSRTWWWRFLEVFDLFAVVPTARPFSRLRRVRDSFELETVKRDNGIEEEVRWCFQGGIARQ